MPALHVNGPRDMFVGDQPSAHRSLKATGRADPGFSLLAVLEGSARSAEPIGDCEIPASQDMYVADVHLERPFPAVEPPQEPRPEVGRSGVLERRYGVEVDDAWLSNRALTSDCVRTTTSSSSSASLALVIALVFQHPPVDNATAPSVSAMT
jgi:hypothetical protein